VLETDNLWVRAIVFIAVWVVVFISIGAVLGKDLPGQTVQGVVSGVAFGMVYTYLQQKED